MEYYLNPKVFSSGFPVPSSIVDKYLGLVTLSQLKVILFVFRNLSDGIDVNEISKAVKIPVSEVEDALLFWSQTEILSIKGNSSSVISDKNVQRIQKPSRQDVAKRGLEDEKIAMLLRETQLKFGRNLKTNETSTLVWIYDDLGLNISVILLILQYAVNRNSLNIRFIEKTAVEFADIGIRNVEQAENHLKLTTEKELSWKRVEKAFGIEHRKPSKKELELSFMWIKEWEISDDVLVVAYDTCVDAKSKFIFSYTAKIIEKWHTYGVKTLSDLEEYKNNIKSSGELDKKSFAGYDIGLFEKMLDEED